MSYIQNSLSRDEKIKHTFGFHWLIWVPAAFVCLIAFLFIVISLLVDSTLPVFVLVLTVWAILYSIYKYLDIRTSERGVTCKRVIAKEGIMSTRSNELRLHEVESVNLHQNLTEKLFGGGTLTLSGTGNKRVTLSSLEDPFLCKRKIEDLLEEASHRSKSNQSRAF